MHKAQHGTKTPDLVVAIKDIRAIQSTGLNLVATVCDQASTNIAAFNILIHETTVDYIKKGTEKINFGFEIQNKEIVPLFDSPHLLKGIQNNLTTTDLSFSIDGINKTARWKDVIQFYEIDKCRLDIGERMTPKLTGEHIYPDKIRNMKVSIASQVFSQRVGSIMLLLSEWSGYNKDTLDKEAMGTAKLLIFIYKLFDSVNSNYTTKIPCKELRSAVTTTSAHWEFWNESLMVLETMHFKNKVPPTIKNWIQTIKGFKYLCKKLLSQGFKFITLRSFNQDPVENFFCQICSHGLKNTNPTCFLFQSSFKSFIINNLISSHSVGANCQADNCKNLTNLKQLLTLNAVFNSNPKEINLHVNKSTKCYTGIITL